MAAGFYGFLDFTGLPVGVPSSVPSGKGKTVGGKWSVHAQAVLAMAAQQEFVAEMNDSVLNHMQQRVVTNSIIRKMEEDYQRRCLESAFFTIALAEV